MSAENRDKLLKAAELLSQAVDLIRESMKESEGVHVEDSTTPTNPGPDHPGDPGNHPQ